MKFFMACAPPDFALPKQEDLDRFAKVLKESGENHPTLDENPKEESVGEFESISINDDATFVPRETWVSWVVPSIQIQIPQLPSLSMFLQKKTLQEKEEVVEEAMKGNHSFCCKRL